MSTSEKTIIYVVIGAIVIFIISALMQGNNRTWHYATPEEISAVQQKKQAQEEQKRKEKLKNELKVKYPWFRQIKEREIDGLPLTTHPSFKDGTAKLVDTENVIESLPEEGKPVWIEKVTGPNSFIISYEVFRGQAEPIITFASIRLKGVSGLQDNECKRKASVDFMKNAVQDHLFWIQNIDTIVAKSKTVIPGVETPTSLIQLQDSINSPATEIVKESYGEFADLATGLVVLGYAETNYDNLKQEQEFAQIKKLGFWGTCDNK